MPPKLPSMDGLTDAIKSSHALPRPCVHNEGKLRTNFGIKTVIVNAKLYANFGTAASYSCTALGWKGVNEREAWVRQQLWWDGTTRGPGSP